MLGRGGSGAVVTCIEVVNARVREDREHIGDGDNDGDLSEAMYSGGVSYRGKDCTVHGRGTDMLLCLNRFSFAYSSTQPSSLGLRAVD